jgi:hypothetical protein
MRYGKVSLVASSASVRNWERSLDKLSYLDFAVIVIC